MALLIREDIKELERELSFLASLNVMDDSISGDVDKRILELIELKQSVFKLPMRISVKGTDQGCIASTVNCIDQEKGINFKQKIFLSFDSNTEIGEIDIILPYRSLEYYFQDISHNWCLRKGEEELLHSCRQDDRLMLSYSINDELILSFLIEKRDLEKPLILLQKQLLVIAIFSFLSFVALFFLVSRAISKPIAQNEKLQSEQLKLQENELHLLEEAKHLAQTKGRFISQMSHDFRTPLNSIIGFSQFLDQEKLVDDEYKKLPKNIEKAGKHLLEMVNQILEFSKVESEYLHLKLEEIDLCTLITEVVELMRPLSEKKSLDLSCSCPEFSFTSDNKMLKNILINLIANAIKFTNEGYVKVSVQREEAYTVISVKDSGIGIDSHDAKSLFQVFSRFEKSKKIEGSGIGLALCYAYSKRLDVQLEYRPHTHGSEFLIKIKTGGVKR